jgi:hypothetical protein
VRLKIVRAADRPQAGDPPSTASAIMQKWTAAVRAAAIVEWRRRPWQAPEWQDPALTKMLAALDAYHRGESCPR